MTSLSGTLPATHRARLRSGVKRIRLFGSERTTLPALALVQQMSESAFTSAVEKHRDARTFIVATEHGIVYQLKKRYPDKEFIVADGCIGCRMHCPYMKMIDLVMVRDALRREKHVVRVPEDVAAGARRALERMIAVPRDA